MPRQYFQDTRVEPLVDGMISLLAKNLIANTVLLSDAHIGDTRLHVGNTLRFEKGEQILIRDQYSVWNPESHVRSGLEFHTIAEDIGESEYLVLKEPLKQDFLVDNSARLQKTIYNVPLYPDDIYYGDREVISWESVAICVEPESMGSQWIALPGTISAEYKMSIFVYVRIGGTDDTRNLAARVCHAYADAINRLLIGQVHLDLDVEDVPLVADANPGDDFVYISSNLASAWGPDVERVYEVQDNFRHEGFLSLVQPGSLSLSSESSSSLSAEWSSATSSLSSLSSLSSSSRPSESSLSSSESSQTSSLSSDTSSSSESSLSSLQNPPGFKVMLSRPLQFHYRVGDKAVLRRRYRYMYDSRVTDINYGQMQKGEMVKAAQLSWFGKETHWYGKDAGVLNVKQIGKGGSAY
jgi:hypothetical protein